MTRSRRARAPPWAACLAARRAAARRVNRDHRRTSARRGQLVRREAVLEGVDACVSTPTDPKARLQHPQAHVGTCSTRMFARRTVANVERSTVAGPRPCDATCPARTPGTVQPRPFLPPCAPRSATHCGQHVGRKGMARSAQDSAGGPAPFGCSPRFRCAHRPIVLKMVNTLAHAAICSSEIPRSKNAHLVRQAPRLQSSPLQRRAAHAVHHARHVGREGARRGSTRGHGHVCFVRCRMSVGMKRGRATLAPLHLNLRDPRRTALQSRSPDQVARTFSLS